MPETQKQIMTARLILLAILVSSAMTACHGSSQTSECTDKLSTYTDDEAEAFGQLNAADYESAFSTFAKASQSRSECVYGTSGRTQALNSSYLALDTAGEAAAARHLGMTEDAEKLMSSAKDLASETLKYHGLPLGVRRAMLKLATTSE